MTEGLRPRVLNGWDALRQRVQVQSEESELLIGGLPGDETYMFVASAS